MLAGHLGTGHRAECPSGLFHPWGSFNGRRHACRVGARAGRGRTKSKSAIAPRHFHARFSVAIGARRLITRRLANETSTLLRRLFRCRVLGRLHPARACGKLVMSTRSEPKDFDAAFRAALLGGSPSQLQEAQSP